MTLFRLHAYSVSPQRTTDAVVEPPGGAVNVTAELRQVLEENTRRARFPSCTEVHFNVDATTRTTQTRDDIMSYAFGESATAKAAAVRLATRLAGAMDLRSTHALFVLAADRDDDRRRVSLWTFPQDDAFQFRNRRSGPTIRLLTDVFSQSSRLRKGAQFHGRKLRNHFLTGRVLDFQASHPFRAVADFWITHFLDCSLAMGNDSGTKLLARTLQKAHQTCEDLVQREQLYLAAMQMRRSTRKRISLFGFADRYLDGDAKATFLGAAPTPDAIHAAFEFQTSVFDEVISFRIFELDNGVYVSSPLTEIGESVKVTGIAEKKLSCKGTIVDEKMRTRHA